MFFFKESTSGTGKVQDNNIYTIIKSQWPGACFGERKTKTNTLMDKLSIFIHRLCILGGYWIFCVKNVNNKQGCPKQRVLIFVFRLVP